MLNIWLGWDFFVSLFFSGLLILSSFFLPQLLFTATPEALRISSWIMRVDAMIFSAYIVLYTCIYAFRAGGLAITVLLIDSCFTWCFSLLVLFLEVKYSPLDIVYIYAIMRSFDVLKMIIALVIYYCGKWVRNLASSMNKVYPEAPPVIDIPKAKDKVDIANF